MDSYDFSRYLGRPTSPPLPDEYSGGYLPQMPAYSDASPSERSSGVPQSIDFGGSVTGYSSDASQSRHTSVPPMPAYSDTSPNGRSSGVPQPIDFGGSASGYSGASQSRRTRVPQIEYGSASQPTSSQGPRIHPPEERAAAVARWRASGKTQKDFAESIAIPRTTFREWIMQADYPTRSNTNYPPEEKSAALSQWHASKETKTQSVRAIYADEDRLKMLSAWRDSKLSQKDYASRIGVPLTTFNTWVMKARDPNTESTETTEEKWSRRISEWQASGLQQGEFARREGFSRSALNEWINKKR